IRCATAPKIRSHPTSSATPSAATVGSTMANIPRTMNKTAARICHPVALLIVSITPRSSAIQHLPVFELSYRSALGLMLGNTATETNSRQVYTSAGAVPVVRPRPSLRLRGAGQRRRLVAARESPFDCGLEVSVRDSRGDAYGQRTSAPRLDPFVGFCGRLSDAV